MKRFFWMIIVILTLFLSGCQLNKKTDISSYSDSIQKAQRITVISSAQSEIIETITAKDDIQKFILALDLDKWKLQTLPDKAIEIGSFNLAQEKTIKYGKTDTDGTLYDVATITLYSDSYIGFKIYDLNTTFKVTKDTADYLNRYFE